MKFILPATRISMCFLDLPKVQVSPVKPGGHKHWKLSSDSKFGTHKAFLGQGSVEQEF